MKLYDMLTIYPFHVVVEPENKLVYLTSVGVPANFERIVLKEGKMSVKFLDEKLRAEYQVFSTKNFSPFFQEFKRQIERLIEIGFKPNHLMSDLKNFNSQHEGIDDGIPALVLNMEDLGIGFMICLVPLVLSVIAFAGELLIPKIYALRDLLALPYLVRNIVSRKIGIS